jgi:2,3-dimethylmalate lyase
MGSTGSGVAQLRTLLDQPEIVVAPGVVDALTARLVEQGGFSAVYATGAGISNSLLGLPDLGLATMTEILEQVRRITDAVEVPVIADIDTGYGNPVNAYRTVAAFERAGTAALQIEDQISPKKCGHFAGKETVPVDEMVAKIRIAQEARSENGPLIIARTDAVATEGFESAIQRGLRYREAGADIIFVEAPESIEEVEQVPKRIDAPLLINMTEGGKTPALSAPELQQLGYKIVIFPNALMRTAAFAVRNAISVLRDTGSSASFEDVMLSWEDRQNAVNIEYYKSLEETFVTNVKV